MATRRRRKVRVPDDTVRRDRTQFLALRRLQAQRRGKSYDDQQVIEHAGIEWDRRQQAERRRRTKTRRLDGRHPELAVPSFLDGLAQAELINMFLQRINAFLAEALRVHYLDDESIADTATHLGLSTRETRRCIRKALEEARSVPRR